LLDGLEIASENMGLRSNYFFLQLKLGRLEKAEQLVREQFGESVDGLPEQLQQYYYFQKSMISLVSGDRDSARELLERALREDTDDAWDGEQVFYITLSSALHREAGNTEIADERLEKAERSVRRARINGLDDASIYYTESSIFALKGESQAALDALQGAYERGFRGVWMLNMDLRLESLHQEPRFIAIRQQIEKDLEQARTEVGSFSLAMH
jgi:tetratricopeptide (TPR) repeat protein